MIALSAIVLLATMACTAQATKVFFVNSCPYAVFIKSSDDHIQPGRLMTAQSTNVDFGTKAWSGSFWAGDVKRCQCLNMKCRDLGNFQCQDGTYTQATFSVNGADGLDIYGIAQAFSDSLPVQVNPPYNVAPVNCEGSGDEEYSVSSCTAKSSGATYKVQFCGVAGGR